MSDSDSDASTAAAERVPPTPEQVKESDEYKNQANQKFKENHNNEAIDLYTKCGRPSPPHTTFPQSYGASSCACNNALISTRFVLCGAGAPAMILVSQSG